MKRNPLLASFSLLCIALALPAAAAPSTLSVKLAAQNGSGENGTATLTQAGGDVQVVIALSGAPATAQPAHIHTGTCSSLGGVAYPLTSVTGGKSTTTVKGVTIAQLLAKPTAINVHESADDLQKYVACGNIAAPSM
jgi:Cu/Zn superoxide dismutase